jgi:hypothetical protein
VETISLIVNRKELNMSLGKILKWAGRRLREPSTYVGLATAASALGAPELGLQIGQAGQLVGLVIGTGLIAATTSAHPPISEIQAAR